MTIPHIQPKEGEVTRPEDISERAWEAAYKASFRGDWAVVEAVARAIDAETARHASIVAALERSMVALDDWLNLYASEFCDEARLKEARERVMQFGTVGYIADVQEQNRTAIRPPHV